jgi:hypothetical protein
MPRFVHEYVIFSVRNPGSFDRNYMIVIISSLWTRPKLIMSNTYNSTQFFRKERQHLHTVLILDTQYVQHSTYAVKCFHQKKKKCTVTIIFLIEALESRIELFLLYKAHGTIRSGGRSEFYLLRIAAIWQISFRTAVFFFRRFRENDQPNIRLFFLSYFNRTIVSMLLTYRKSCWNRQKLDPAACKWPNELSLCWAKPICMFLKGCLI